MRRSILVLLPWLGMTMAAFGADEPSAQRGKQALLSRAFTPATWSLSSFDNAWKHWDPKPTEKPDNYVAAFREHYGLPEAPFANDRYPLGLRVGATVFGTKGLATDCMLCHGGSILGKSYVGLGNSALEIQSLFEDLGKATGAGGKTPFVFSRARGTSEAGAMAVFLLSYREPDLKVRLIPQELHLRDDLVEDTPAWWLLKKKKTMYHTGTSDARSVRSIMQFMLSPFNAASVFDKEEATFRDIREYLLTLEPPRYPLPIDAALVGQGEKLFAKTCAQCHGTYGPEGRYPNKIVAIDVIGTDRNRFEGFSPKVGEFYNRSWLAKETAKGYEVTAPLGYQAPPLDGLWATAPYFHNGSAPTLHDVLNSKARPRIFTRSYRTDAEAFDAVKVGWKVRVLDQVPGGLAPVERRKIYDTTQSGRGNGGHTFGDDLSAEQRRAVIEYLKTL